MAHMRPTLTDDEMWRAVTERDEDFDGAFLYGVASTKIFCRPSCTARRPLRRNVRFFADAGEAMDLGFRPCKLCRPDLPAYDPQRELVEQEKGRLNRSLHEEKRVAPAVSRRHLARLFVQYEGCTRARYAARMMAERAAELLANTEKNVLDVAHESGFESPSSFYRHFRERWNATPREFRETQRREKTCSSKERRP